jgi:uncharacterized protein involved in outer membrane biogenesis
MRKTRLLLLLLAAPLLLGADLPFGRQEVREYILGRLSEMTGRDFDVAGEMDIDLGWEPSVRLDGVRVANAEWAESPHLLTLDALEVTLDMRRLLQGEVRLPRLALIGPRLFLEVSEEGTPNWVLGGEEQTIVESAAAPEGEPGNLPRIDRLEVKGGELAYLDHSAPSPEWIRGDIADAGGSLDAHGVDFAASGTLGGESYTIVLRTAPLDDLRAGQDPNPVYLLATAGGARLMVDGTLVAPFELRGIDLALEAHGSGFDQLPLVTGLPESPPFDLEARLLREDGPWRLRDLTAAVGRSEMTGQATLDLTGKTPRISAELEAGTLALGELLAILPEGADAPEPAAEAEGEGLDLSALEALDADIRFSAEELFYHRLRLAEVRADLMLQDGALTLAPISAAAGGGRVSTRLTLRPDPLRGSARFELDDVNLQQALAELELGERRLGVLDGTIAVELPPPPEGAPAPGDAVEIARVLQRLRVEEGHVTYREPGQDTSIVLALGAGPLLDGPRIHARGRFRGAPVRADVSADPLTDLTAQGPYQLDGTVRVGNTEGEVHAAILSPPDLEDLRVTFDLTGDFGQLGELTGAPIPELPQLKADGVLRRSGPLWTARDLDVTLGRSDIAGQIAMDTSGPRPRIGAQLHSDTLDLPTLLPGDGAPAPPEPAEGEPLDLPGFLTEVDARLSYDAGRILTAGPVIRDLSIDTRLENGRLRLGPLHLSYRAPEQDTRLDVDLTAAEAPGARGLTGSAEGRFRGTPVDAELRADAWIDLTEEGPPGAWQVRLAPGETELTLSGGLRDLLSPETLDLTLSAQGPSPERLSDLVGVPLPDTPPSDLRAGLRRDGGRIILEDLQGRVGESDIAGRIAVDLANEPPDLAVDLRSDRLDYDDLTALFPEDPPEERDQLFSDEPLGLRELAGQVQGRLRYRAREVMAGEIPFDDLRVEATLRAGRFALDPLRVGVGGGGVRLKLDMDTGAEPPAADLEGEIRRVRLSEVLAPFEIADESVGTVGGEVKVWMRGDSTAGLAGSADGGLFLVMTGGTLDMLLVEAAGLDPGEAIFAALGDDTVPIDCAYLNLQSRSGQVDIETLAVDTRDTLFLGGGQIDLDRERLELVIEPRPKDPSVLSFSSPLRLEGPLTDPELQVVSGELVARGALAVGLAAITPLAGLIPLIEPGTGGESAYCTGLMEALREAAR